MPKKTHISSWHVTRPEVNVKKAESKGGHSITYQTAPRKRQMHDAGCGCSGSTTGANPPDPIAIGLVNCYWTRVGKSCRTWHSPCSRVAHRLGLDRGAPRTHCQKASDRRRRFALGKRFYDRSIGSRTGLRGRYRRGSFG